MNKQKTETSVGNPDKMGGKNSSAQLPPGLCNPQVQLSKEVLYFPRILIQKQPQAFVGNFLSLHCKNLDKKQEDKELGWGKVISIP